MTREDIFEGIQEILSEELDIDKDEVQLGSNLINDIGLSSVEVMNLIASVEKAFSIRISEKLLRTFVTTQDIVDCIAAKLEG